jgi:uncharacterized protein YdeI (YjbR/CyaY-like superfamily)
MGRADAERIHPESRVAWRAWLKRNHARPVGVWVITWKKDTGKPRLEYDEGVEEALCWGWIDSKPAKLDAERSMLWYSPRKPGSAWSAPNKVRVARAIESGRMQPAGLAKVEAARSDGSWDRLNAVDALEVPADLSAAFRRFPGSKGHFERFPISTKKGILEWILQAKRPETRAARVEQTARLAADNIRANQWRGK